MTNHNDAVKIQHAVETGECPSCAVANLHTPATTKTHNPDFQGYQYCEECAAEYDARVGTVVPITPPGREQ